MSWAWSRSVARRGGVSAKTRKSPWPASIRRIRSKRERVINARVGALKSYGPAVSLRLDLHSAVRKSLGGEPGRLPGLDRREAQEAFSLRVDATRRPPGLDSRATARGCRARSSLGP